jgi:hypothetical protein
LKTFPNSAISASAKTYQYIMQLYICIYPNSLSLYIIYIYPKYSMNYIKIKS